MIRLILRRLTRGSVNLAKQAPRVCARCNLAVPPSPVRASCACRRPAPPNPWAVLADAPPEPRVACFSPSLVLLASDDQILWPTGVYLGVEEEDLAGGPSVAADAPSEVVSVCSEGCCATAAGPVR